jgi:hypothetical protein
MPRRRTVTSPSFDPGDIGGGSDDDSGGGGGGDDGGSTGPSRQGRSDRTDGDGGASVTVPAPDDDDGGSPGGSTPPTGDVGGPDTVDDTGAGDSDPRNAPSAQQPETGTDTPNIEGGDQRLFNEAAEQRRDRQQSAAQSGGDQRLRNEATPNIEGGDQRLFNEAAEQRRPEEQFGDDPVQNPVTGNRLETDLQGLSDRFQSGATDALRSVSARPDRTGVSTVRQTAVETADPFELALAAKEGVEFVGDVRDRVPADDISNQERLDALADGELPESDSRESFVDDVEERTGAIARGTVDRATSSPGEFGLEVATGFVGGTVAASAARRGTQVARSADVSVADELDAVRTFARDDRAMADFPDQRTITREETVTRQSDLDRLETAVEDMTLRDRARQRLPPREEFESDAAFQRELDALEQRLAERELEEIAEDTDADAATQQGDGLLDDLQDEQTPGTQRRGRGRQREAEATVDRDSEGLLTDVAAGTTAATGTQLEAEATQVAGQQGAVGASLGLQQGTQLNQGIQTDLADDVSVGISADTTAGQPTDTIGGQQTTTQTGTQTTTTTTTTTTRGSSGSGGTRGRPRPELPDFDNSADDEEFRLDSGLGEETVVNPTRTLQEVDDDLQAMFGGADRGP